MVDPNRNEKPLEMAKSCEVGNRHKSILPKNYLTSNVIGNMDDSMVIRRRFKHNKIGFSCYTSQLEPKNVEEAFEDESWTTTL